MKSKASDDNLYMLRNDTISGNSKLKFLKAIWKSLVVGVVLIVILMSLLFWIGVRGDTLNGFVTWVSMLVIAALGVYFYSIDFNVNRLYIKKLQSLYEQLDDLFIGQGYRFGSDYNNIQNDPLNQIMSASIVGEDWKILSTSDYYIKSYKKGEVHNKYITIDLVEIFNPYNSFKSIRGYNRRSQMASIMTGLGILGTFLGLTIGLFGLDLTQGIGNDFNAQVNKLISGSGTAFATSLLGIATSLIYTFTLNYQKAKADAAYQQLLKLLYANIPYLSTNELLIQLDESLKQQNRTLDNLAEDVVSQLGEVFEEKAPAVFDAALGDKFEAIEKNLSNVADGLLAMKDSFESFQDSTSKGIGDMLVASASHEMNALNATLENLRNMVADLQEESVTSREQQGQFISNVSQTLESSMQNMSRETTHMIDLMKSSVGSSITEINTTMNQMVESIRSEQISSQEAFAMSTKSLLSEITETTSQGLADVMNTLQGTLSKANDIIATYAHKQEQSMEEIFALTQGVTEILESTKETVSAMDNVMERTNESVDIISKSNMGIVEQVESISDFAHIMTDYEKEMKLNLAKVESVLADQQIKIASKVQPLVESLTSSTEANNDSVESMRATISALEHAWEDHEATYKEFTEELQDIFNQIMDGVRIYHEQLNSNMRDSMVEFDNNLTSAVSGLKASVSDLIDGRESFKEVVDKRILALQSVIDKQ